MAITVMISLEVLTRFLYFTPTAILASIILSALPGLIDVSSALHIWKLNKLDFLVLIAAFFGVLFASVEIGLLLAVSLSLSYTAFIFLALLKSYPCRLIIKLLTIRIIIEVFVIIQIDCYPEGSSQLNFIYSMM